MLIEAVRNREDDEGEYNSKINTFLKIRVRDIL
jgi:hypothetical protein